MPYKSRDEWFVGPSLPALCAPWPRIVENTCRAFSQLRPCDRFGERPGPIFQPNKPTPFFSRRRFRRFERRRTFARMLSFNQAGTLSDLSAARQPFNRNSGEFAMFFLPLIRASVPLVINLCRDAIGSEAGPKDTF